MKELEQIIIGSIFGEDQYRKVSFLEPDDFSNYPSKPYREYFKLIKEVDADEECLVEALSKCKDMNLKLMMFTYSTSLGANNPERYAVKLVEIRFKRVFALLVHNLSLSTKKDSERALLNEASLMVNDADVFELSDYLLEYLGHHATDYTIGRINSFLSYRNKRLDTVKKVINEISS